MRCENPQNVKSRCPGVGPMVTARGHMEGGPGGKVGTHSIDPTKVEFRGRNRSRWMQSRSSRPSESVDFAILGIGRL
jgi:hypothetical protein